MRRSEGRLSATVSARARHWNEAVKEGESGQYGEWVAI
jgi:hypothetical protein